MKNTPNPIIIIQRDILKQIEMTYECALMIPTFHQKEIVKKCERILKKYKIKKSKWPTLKIT